MEDVVGIIFFGSLINAKSKGSAHVSLGEGSGENLEMFLLRKRSFIMINESKSGQVWYFKSNV